MIGQLLTGRYLILKQLGAGGFSETYLAVDKYLLDQPACVVKRLSMSAGSTISPEKARQLFETEARVLNRLGRQYSQIPTLFAYCHEQDQVYQVEEYIRGENLDSWFTQGHCLSPDAAADLLRKVLPILDHIHRHDVIHQDIKPSNLIRQEDGDITLIDFGAACDLAEIYESCDPQVTQIIAIGTPGYMPEEQQIGYSQFNSDLYALGVSVIQLLTGIRPQQFQTDPATGELDWQIYLRHRSIDPGLVAILNQMVRRDYRLRYQRASEVAAALESLPWIEKYSLRSSETHAKQQKAMPKNIWQKIWKPALVLLSATAIGGGYCLSQREHTELLLQIGLTNSQLKALLQSLSDLSATEKVDQAQIPSSNQALVEAQPAYDDQLWIELTRLVEKTASEPITGP
ncbi:MAG: serine/threonine protein kinase [Elainella sp. C42_A2020_010]|nr:serine/threonine protein kinase [Elainella sp. C42_A2020_010]